MKHGYLGLIVMVVISSDVMHDGIAKMIVLCVILNPDFILERLKSISI